VVLVVKTSTFRAIKYTLTFSIFFGMLFAVMHNQVVVVLAIFAVGFAILQIVNAKYKKELEAEQR